MVRLSNHTNLKNKITDVDIIKILINDGRRTFVEIAKELEVTETAIRKRVKRMENEGIIEGYTVEINPRKLGYGIKVLIGIDTTPQRYISTIQKLKRDSDILRIYSSNGDHMIMLECWFEDDDKLASFMSKIETIDGITDICPAILTDIIK
ncbi:MAG: Lrp/AsnC family transcriptional regulator [Candidatus Heimdallarchaeota archaeon]|nr:Lrp/AsnC family transcriptional regulator [Candidatus Heimdallarchaeota archaeon]MCK5143104.1 Lrp/AsnC family transcriptional regulator [Candidatus Heimdallarchaeota archaeon]